MTVTDQIKILDRKITQNKSQYDLDREATKISALSSNNFDKLLLRLLLRFISQTQYKLTNISIQI